MVLQINEFQVPLNQTVIIDPVDIIGDLSVHDEVIDRPELCSELHAAHRKAHPETRYHQIVEQLATHALIVVVVVLDAVDVEDPNDRVS